MQGGGFGYLSSKLGLMVDQVLSLEVVTAEGRFVHADPEENRDLFWVSDIEISKSASRHVLMLS
jgi:FAD/FMN-containing dehydrogenase